MRPTHTSLLVANTDSTISYPGVCTQQAIPVKCICVSLHFSSPEND